MSETRAALWAPGAPRPWESRVGRCTLTTHGTTRTHDLPHALPRTCHAHSSVHSTHTHTHTGRSSSARVREVWLRGARQGVNSCGRSQKPPRTLAETGALRFTLTHGGHFTNTLQLISRPRGRTLCTAAVSVISPQRHPARGAWRSPPPRLWDAPGQGNARPCVGPPPRGRGSPASASRSGPASRSRGPCVCPLSSLACQGHRAEQSLSRAPQSQPLPLHPPSPILIPFPTPGCPLLT